jgi:hypothetical protein
VKDKENEDEEGEDKKDEDKKEEKLTFKVLYNEKLYDIEVEGLNSDTEIVYVQNPQKEPIILI